MTTDVAAVSRPPKSVDLVSCPRSSVLSSPFGGMAWFAGWLFTIGFAPLGFWKAVLALILWPYFLGVLAR